MESTIALSLSKKSPPWSRSVFWDDVEQQLEGPEFRRHFVLEQNRIQTADRVMNLLIDALETSSRSRADVARAVDSHASAIRRLLGQDARAANPTLQTLTDVAAVLGFQVDLVPMDRQTRHRVTDQLTVGFETATRGQSFVFGQRSDVCGHKCLDAVPEPPGHLAKRGTGLSHVVAAAWRQS